MLAEMTWTQMQGWQEYDRLEPMGEERADLRMGILASIIANTHRDPKKRSKPFEPSDFIPKFREAIERRQAKARKPLATVEGWQHVKNMAKAIYGAKK